MTSTPIYTKQPNSTQQTLPTMYDLPSEYPEEPGLPDISQDHWLPTDTERLAEERQRSDRMAAKLRELGIDPNDI